MQVTFLRIYKEKNPQHFHSYFMCDKLYYIVHYPIFFFFLYIYILFAGRGFVYPLKRRECFLLSQHRRRSCYLKTIRSDLGESKGMWSRYQSYIFLANICVGSQELMERFFLLPCLTRFTSPPPPPPPPPPPLSITLLLFLHPAIASLPSLTHPTTTYYTSYPFILTYTFISHIFPPTSHSLPTLVLPPTPTPSTSSSSFCSSLHLRREIIVG